MEESSVLLTKEGQLKLMEELHELKNMRRKEIAARISEAKELGDLKENAEYHTAKQDQAFTEGRIAELEYILRNSKVIEKNRGDFVQIGSTIHIDMSGKRMKYTIVGATEADPSNGKISHQSPFGSAFMGKLPGDTVEVKIPTGMIRCTILEVE